MGRTTSQAKSRIAPRRQTCKWTEEAGDTGFEFHLGGCCPLTLGDRLTRTFAEQRYAAGSRQRAVGSGQWAVGSGQWAVGSGRRAAGGGRRAAGSRQQAAGSKQQAATRTRTSSAWLPSRRPCRTRLVSANKQTTLGRLRKASRPVCEVTPGRHIGPGAGSLEAVERRTFSQLLALGCLSCSSLKSHLATNPFSGGFQATHPFINRWGVIGSSGRLARLESGNKTAESPACRRQRPFFL